MGTYIGQQTCFIDVLIGLLGFKDLKLFVDISSESQKIKTIKFAINSYLDKCSHKSDLGGKLYNNYAFIS